MNNGPLFIKSLLRHHLVSFFLWVLNEILPSFTEFSSLSSSGRVRHRFFFRRRLSFFLSGFGMGFLATVSVPFLNIKKEHSFFSSLRVVSFVRPPALRVSTSTY